VKISKEVGASGSSSAFQRSEGKAPGRERGGAKIAKAPKERRRAGRIVEGEKKQE
jgi:hypothetical protein